ncbi:hypothetical protein [Stutzerimonas kunmingensis]|uniref:hypothetical protein n=1 Tax=Stutzerimonas kunmingensis TaxID=1211807 RepID=UPI00241FD87F|nr:hypothetical protein [Stutzerimonas kunmingensis]
MRYSQKADLTPRPYRLLKNDLAAKLSARSQGGITYYLLADGAELYIAIVGNEGGGLWSKEVVSLTAIEAAIEAAGEPFATKALRAAIVGRSSNNAPFTCAVLRDLDLIAPAPDKAHQHIKTGDWPAFREHWLAQAGEDILYPAPVEAKAEDHDASGEAAEAGEEGDTSIATAPASKPAKRKKAREAEAAQAIADEALAATVNGDQPEEARLAPAGEAHDARSA